VTLVIGIASLTGVHAHEAFQLIDNAGGVFYALTYLVLFAIPLFGMNALGVRSPWWLKLACASGFIVTLIYIRYAVEPITEVTDPQTFGLKIIVVVLLANIVGVALYVLRKQKPNQR
jgi:glutamate:GABA antiporter